MGKAMSYTTCIYAGNGSKVETKLEAFIIDAKFQVEDETMRKGKVTLHKELKMMIFKLH